MLRPNRSLPNILDSNLVVASRVVAEPDVAISSSTLEEPKLGKFDLGWLGLKVSW